MIKKEGLMKRQRVGTVLALTAGLLLLTGCGEPAVGSSSDPVEETSSLVAKSESLTDLLVVRESSYDYRTQQSERDNLMTSNEMLLYDQVGEVCSRITEKEDESGSYKLDFITLEQVELSEEEIKIAVTAFKNDHPEIFWLTNRYGVGYSQGSTIVQLYSYVSAEECEEMAQSLSLAVQEMIDEIDGGQTERGRELAAFQLLADRCVYDDTATDEMSSDGWQSYTVYGALVNGTAVCEGYARGMQLLLSNLDMTCRLICGKVNDINHMWNLVQVNDQWYHLDPTSNDQKAVVIYDYFNVTDEAIGTDHQIAPQLQDMTAAELTSYMETGAAYNLSLPECTDEMGSYLKNDAVTVGTFRAAEDRQVVQSLRQAAATGASAVYWYLDPDVDFDMAVKKLFDTKNAKIFSYIDEANSIYGSRKILRSEVTYLSNPDFRSITVLLKYDEED
jgi:hypothetical protein